VVLIKRRGHGRWIPLKGIIKHGQNRNLPRNKQNLILGALRTVELAFWAFLALWSRWSVMKTTRANHLQRLRTWVLAVFKLGPTLAYDTRFRDWSCVELDGASHPNSAISPNRVALDTTPLRAGAQRTCAAARRLRFSSISSFSPRRRQGSGDCSVVLSVIHSTSRTWELLHRCRLHSFSRFPSSLFKLMQSP